jgi:hypothetical protein
MKTFLKVALVIVAISLVGCRGRGRAAGGHFVQPWYDVYGFHCGSGQPRPGCNFYADGSKIRDYSDPYFSSNWYTFGTVYYYNSYNNFRSYTGWTWTSSTGIIYDEFGFALNKSGTGESFDTVGNAAEQEQSVVVGAAADLADRYALSSDVALRVTTTLNEWNNVKKYRTVTAADADDYNKRLFGVTIDQAAAALMAASGGDKAQLTQLNEQVAGTWKTNKETSEEILRTWYEKELADLSI